MVTEAAWSTCWAWSREQEAADAVEIARTTGGVRKVVKMFEYCKPTDQLCRPRPPAKPAEPRTRSSHLSGSVPPPAFERKILAPADAARWAARLARPLVFTNGVFDILHRGHVTYLAQARALGAALLVALNGDASARRLGKGAGATGQCARGPHGAASPRSKRSTAVTWFDEDTPRALIAACRPDVLVKGGDWPVERIVGASEVLARGGAVHSIPFEHQRSTTALLRRIGGRLELQLEKDRARRRLDE